MNFEWDEAKNEQNIHKHGIDFADVPTIFDSTMLIDLDDREDYGEDRWIGMGLLKDNVMVIIFTERLDHTRRIISARKANKNESKRYFDSLAY